MITKLSIRNFKCLRDVQIDLERFTVFVGPNASGKSSILQALDFLCRAFGTGVNAFGFGLMQPFGGVPDLSEDMSRGAKGPIELAAEAGGAWYRYRIGLPPAPAMPPHFAQAGWNGQG